MKLKIGQRIEYLSFGKTTKATIKNIKPEDKRPLKILPDYNKLTGHNVSIKMDKVLKVIK